MQREHLPAYAEFVRSVWDPSATVEHVSGVQQDASVTENGSGPIVFLCLSREKVIGHVSALPFRLWYQGSEYKAHWVKGLMVLPEHRNGPVGFLVLREAMSHLDTALALVVRKQARRLFDSLDFHDMGPLSNRLRPLRTARILQRLDPSRFEHLSAPRVLGGTLGFVRRTGLASLAGAMTQTGLEGWSSIASSVSHRIRTSADESIQTQEIELLWKRIREEVAASPVRDARYLTSRYEGLEASRYRFLLATERAQPVGFAALRRPRADGDERLRGIRVATVSELICSPHRSDVAIGLLHAAEEEARSLDADAILCSASHRSLDRPLTRRAYLPLSPTVHLLTYRGESLPAEEVIELGDWWITRGDSFADEVL